MRLLGAGLVALGLIAWLLRAGPTPQAPEPGAGDASPIGSGPSLTAGAHPVEAAATSEAPAEGVAPSDGRTWRLLAHVRVLRHSRFGSVSWSEPGEDEEASPFAGVAVLVELRRGEVTRKLARGVLDTRGRVSLVLPALGALTPLERACTRVHVIPEDGRVGPPRRTPLMRRGVSLHHAVPPARPDDDDVVMHVIVPALLREAVTGRALWPNGRPVAHGEVSTYGSGGASADDTCTDDEGRFAFLVHEGGRFNLSVRAENGASRYLEDLELRAGATRDLGDVVVGGEATFAGRYVYPDGAPVAGLRVMASHHYTNMHVNSLSPSLTCQSHGLGVATWTDADGRFTLHAFGVGGNNAWSILADMEGDVRATMPDDGRNHPKKPRRDLGGTVRGHRIRLRVVDEEGRAVPGAEVNAYRPEEEVANERRRWSTPDVHTDRDGRGDFWFTHGSAWRLVVLKEGAAPLEHSLSVPGAGNESDLELRLTSIDLTSGLRAYLTSADGTSLFPAVLTVRTKDGVEVWSRRAEEGGVFVALAPGTYDVELRSVERAPWKDGHMRWLRARSLVHVPSGSVVDVRAVVGEAAHLRVRVERSEADALRIHHARVHLEHVDTGRTLSPFLSMSSQKVLWEELEPGWWTVRFESRGFRSVTKRVELRAAEVAAVTFTAEPMPR